MPECIAPPRPSSADVARLYRPHRSGNPRIQIGVFGFAGPYPLSRELVAAGPRQVRDPSTLHVRVRVYAGVRVPSKAEALPRLMDLDPSGGLGQPPWVVSILIRFG